MNRTADSFREKLGEPTGEPGDLAARYETALRREHQLILRRRSLTGTYCHQCGGPMREGHHIDPLDDADHAAVAENDRP